MHVEYKNRSTCKMRAVSFALLSSISIPKIKPSSPHVIKFWISNSLCGNRAPLGIQATRWKQEFETKRSFNYRVFPCYGSYLLTIMIYEIQMLIWVRILKALLYDKVLYCIVQLGCTLSSALNAIFLKKAVFENLQYVLAGKVPILAPH